MIRVLVCGGRRYDNETNVFHVLDGIHAQDGIAVIIEGGCVTRLRMKGVIPPVCVGADHFAARWALLSGVSNRTFVPDWLGLGPAAGPIRNQQMLDVGLPDLVLAFPGGGGTRDMVRRARKMGVRVREEI